MFDDAAVLLTGARHESRDVNKRDHRDIERIAKPNESRGFDTALNVQTSGQNQRVISDDADRLPFHPPQTDDDIGRIVGLQLKEITVINDLMNQLLDVIWLVCVIWNQSIERHIESPGRVTAGTHRRFLAIVQRQIIEKPTQHQDRFDIVLKSKISHAASSGVS